MSITLRHIKGSPLTHEEMDDNFSALTGSLTAGAGLTGGGLKEDELTFDVGQGDGIQVNPDSVQVDSTVARRNSANIFTGNQTISGSLYVTGSSEFIGNSKFVGDQTITGSLFTSGSSEFIGTSLFQGDQIITGSLSVLGSTDFQGASIFEGNQTITGSLFVSGTFEHTGIINLKPTSPPATSTSPQAYIYSSGSEGDLYFRQTSPRGLNETRLRWLEGNVYTGILSGGVVSGSVGGTTFNVSEGSGLIVTLNASTGSEEVYPIFNYVEWNDFTNISPDYLATEDTTWLLIDSNGDLIQQAIAPTNGQFADNITLGAVIHPNNTTISIFKTFPVTSYGLAQQTYEFIRVFGPIKKSGHTISAGTTSLTVDRASGVSFALGRNYVNDPDDPSLIEDPAQSEATIFRYYASGSEFVTVPNQSTIDPTNYNTPDTPTGLTAVAAGQYSIQKVFFFPDQPNILAVYYGRDTYNTIATALDNLNFEPFQEIENTISQAIFLGYIIVKSNATDLSVAADARFIQAGNFRSTATSGGGGSAEVVTNLGDLSDVTFGTLVNGDLLVYNGAEWQNRQNNLTVSGSFSGSFQGSDIDVTSGSFDRLDVSGNGQVGGNLTVGGIITAQEFHTEFVSASIIYESGSTKFGDTLDDTHDFTGSVNISGSFEVTGSGTISGDLVVGGTVTAQEFHTEFVSASIIFQSGSTKFGDTQDDIHAFTGSVSITGSSLSMTGNITGSSNLDIAGTVDANVYSINDVVVVDSSRNITGSNSIFSGYISGSSLDVTGNIDGNNVSINDTIVIDSSRNITGSNAHFSGYISGSSLDVTGNIDGNDISINDTIVIDSSRNITGSNAHFSGYVSGSSLDVTGNIDGNNVSINDTIVIDSSRNITGSNAHFSGYVSASSLDVTGRSDANEYSINDTIVIDSGRNVTGSNADFSGTVDANEYSINDVIVIDSSRNVTGSNADFSGNVDINGNITVLGNSNLGDSTTNDLHLIKGITQVTGSFSTDDIKLDGSVISTFTGNLELNPAKILDLKSNVTASANDFKFQHTGTGNFTLTSDNGNIVVENSTFSGDDVTIPGDLAVNGGDITTTSGTGNIFNANATTLNIGGAATTLELGASTGTTSINNDLTVDGNATFGDAEADRIDIRGQIIALSGSNTVIEQRSTGAGSLRIQSIGSTNNKLILSASGDIEVKQSVTMTDLGTSIQSSGYQSGFAGQGFDINYGPKSSAEFDNLTVRGSMRVFELLINQVRATNGSLFVSSTGKVDSVVDLGTTDGQGRQEYALIFDTGSGTVGHGFTDGDVIRAQQVDRNAIANAGDTQNVDGSLVFRSDLIVTDVQDLKIVTASLSQSSTPPSSSYEFVRLGSATNVNRRGNVYLTSDDNYAPFIDIVDGITDHSDWNNAAVSGGVKVRLGKIDGINSPVFGDLDGYGMWASGSVYLEGSINATAGLIGGWAITPGYLQSNNIKLQSSGSEGGELISIGQNASMTGNGVFLSGSGDFNLQTDSNNFIRKSGNLLDIKSEEFSLSTGNLTISGSSTDGFISLGTLTDASTVSNTNDGFFVSASGDVLIKGGAIADNRYIKVNSSGLEIKTDVFDLDAGQLELFGNTDSAYLKMGTLANAKDTNNTNYGVYIDHSGSLLLKSTDVDKNYIRVSGSGFIDINADKFKLQAGSPVSLVLTEADGGFLALGGSNYTDAQIALSGSGEAKFGNINVDGTDGGSIFSGTTALSTTASPGLFLSGSGEFNLVYDTDNFIRRVGTKLSIGATTASINTPTLDLNTAAGGTIALGDTEGINPPNLSNPGIFLSGSGEFNFELDDDNRITRNGSLLEIRSTDFIIETSTFDVSTEVGGFFRLGPGAPSMTNQGIFMSGSGEFNFEQDDDNRLTFDGGLFELRATDAVISGSSIQIATTDLEIDTSTFALNTDAGGTIALGDTPPTNLSSNGIFLSGSGEFNFQSGSNDRLTFSNGTLELRATDVVLKGDTVEISGSNFHLLNGNITASNVDLSGKITATSGEIGGFTISQHALAGNNFYISGSATSNEFFISASNFNVKANGDLTASNATITGEINSTSGNIGGWSLGTDNLNNGNVYLSNSGSTKGLFIEAATGPNRLQVGEFDPVTPSPTTLSQGTRTTGSAGDKIFVNAVSPPSFTLNAISSTADSGSINIPINGSVSTGDTVYVSQPVDFSYLYSDSSIAGVTDFATIKVEITSGSANTVVARNSLTRPSEYPIEKTLAVSYYYTGSTTLSSGDLDVKISYSSHYNRTTDPGNLTEVTVSGTTIQKDSARVNITNSQALFYQGPGRKFEWTPGGITFEGGEITVEDITTDDATITGRLTANTDVIITSSNTNVIAIDARDANQDGLIWGIASDGDPYFAPIDNGTYDFSSELRYRLDLERWDVESKLYVGNKLEVNSSITGSQLQLTGLSSITATSLLGVDGSGNVGTTTSAISSYTNGVDNRVLTSTGATGINGEANLTFDGSELRVNGAVSSSTLDVAGLSTTQGGISTDGNAKTYTWRVDNSGGSAVTTKIASLAGSQSTRVEITLIGQQGYSNGVDEGCKTVILGQFNNNNNFEGHYYCIGKEDGVNGVKIEQTGTNTANVWIERGTFSEYAVQAVISDGTLTPDDTDGTPTTPTVFEEYIQVNSNISGSITILGDLTVEGDTNLEATVTGHINTTGPGDTSNTGGTVIQNLQFDSTGYGHVEGVLTADLDSRYLQSSDLTGYVQKSGDTMTGKLKISSGGLEVTGSVNFQDTLSVGGIITGDAFRTNTSNTNYSLITRNEAAASHSLHVQNGINSSDSIIARFAYGSLAANSGTTVLQIAGDQSYFDNTKLGIGTDNPVSLLHLEDVSSPTLRIKDTTNNVTLLAYAQNSDAHIGTYSNHDLVFDTNSTPRMTIDNGGDVSITNNLTVGGIVTAQEFHTEFVSASIVFNSGSTKFGDTSDDIHSFSGSLRVTGSGDHYITNGNVGIGTSTSIQEKLHLNGGTDDVALRIDTTGADPKIRLTTLTQQDWSLGVDYDDAGKFKIAESGFPGTNDALVIDVNRNVGINTSDPDARLHINTPSSGLANQKFESVGSAAWRLGIPAGQTYFAFDNANDDLSAPKVVINSDGDVGIGTDNPTYELDVAGDIGVNQYIYHNGDDNTYIRFQTDDINLTAGGSNLFRVDNTAPVREIVVNEAGAATDFRVESDTVTAALFVTGSTGNVGIGTTAPGTKLHVKDSSAGAGVVLKLENAGANGAAQLDLTNDAQSWFVNTRTDDKFSIYNNTASTTALTIDTSDNVGIGTTSPPHKFSVFGTGAGNATVQIEGEGGADPFINFLANNTQHWALGIDDSDSDKFKLSEHSALGTNDYFVVDTSGNVGIGTNSPSSFANYKNLSIKGGSSGANLDFHNSSGTRVAAIVSNPSTNFIVETNEATPFILKTNETERMRIDASGRVGIGVTPESWTVFTPIQIGQASTFAGRTSANQTDVANNWYYDGAEKRINAGYAQRYVQDVNGDHYWMTAGTSTADSTISFSTPMIIKNSGNVGINESTPSQKLHVDGKIRATSWFTGADDTNTLFSSTSAGTILQTPGLTENDNDSKIFFRHSGGTVKFTFDCNSGDATFVGDLNVDTLTAVSIIETSTRELKDNIITLGSQEEIVDKLQPVSYTWKEDGVEDFGLIAEDVEEIAPHLVSRDDNGNPTGIKYSKLSVLLLDVVKKQSTMIEDLNKRITKLEDKT